MPVINGVYTKDFPDIGRTPADADIIPIAEVANQITYKTTIGAIFNAKISGTTGRITKFTGSNTVGNSILNEIGNAVHLTDGTSSYASFGIINPGTPGDPGVDNDCYIGSTINNDFTFRVNNIEAGRFDTALRFKISNIPNAITDTDQFLVSDGGIVKYRTASEMISDLNVVTIDTNQTITGQKTFTADILANAVTLDPTPATIPTAQGSIYFDGDTQTVAAVLNGVTMKIGEDTFYQIKNQSGSPIAKGTALRFDGVVGASGRVKAVPFLANGTYPSIYFLGVAYEDIPKGGDGKALWFGKVRGINTNAYPAGTVLYASTTVAGGYQTNAPTAPNNIITVAAVVNQGTSNGELLVRPLIGSNINNDEGVKITSPTTGDLLQLQSSGLWENKTVASLGLVPQSRQLTINGTSYDLSANRSWTIPTHDAVTIGTANGLSLSGQQLSLGLASSSTNGALSSTDWNTFNNKVSTATLDNYVTLSTTQTITGAKTFSLDSSFNGVRIGRGGGNISTNTRVGLNALSSNTTGNANSAFGSNALASNTTGHSNNAFGFYALNSNISGYYNVGVGNYALGSNDTGHSNTAIGQESLTFNTSGYENVGVGIASLLSNTTGFSNTAVGSNALRSNTTGGYNTAVGDKSLYSITTGIYNTALGNTAGDLINSGGANQTSNYSVYLGYDTRASANGNTNEIVIGSGARGNGSNTVTIGNSSITDNYFSGNLSVEGLSSSVAGSIRLKMGNTASTTPNGYASIAGISNVAFDFINKNTSGDYKYYRLNSILLPDNTLVTYGLPSSSGTIALTSDITSAISGTTNYIPKFTNANTIGNSNLINDANGNLGLGVIPSAWVDYKVLQFVGGSISSYTNNNFFEVNQNAYWNGVYRYVNNGFASRYQQNVGRHEWYQAISGTAGNTISFTQAMTLFANGNLGLGQTTDAGYKLDVNGTGRFSGAVELVGDLKFNSNSADRSIYFRGATGSPDGNWKMGNYLNPTGATIVNLAATVIDVFGGAAGYGFMVRNTSNAPLLQIAGNTGAATFSSSVTAQNDSAFYRIKRTSGTDLGYITDSTTWGDTGTDLSIGASSSNLRFYTNNSVTERMRITSGGNVLIGTTTITGSHLLQVNGSVLATAYFESSSVAGKNILTTNPVTQLNLDVIKYTRKSDENKDVRYGYSAEQVHAIMPELTDKDVSSVKYLDVHTVLIAQLQQEIKELKARLN